MAYSPLNLKVFTAAFAGALAGMGVSGKTPTSAVSTDYAGLATTAGAFAQKFDTTWNAVVPTTYQVEAIQEACEAAWQERVPPAVAPFITAAVYANEVAALIAVITAGSTYLAAQGVPDPIAGAPPGSYVYQPGGTARANVFTSWAALVTAVAATTGDLTIVVDSEFGPANFLGLPVANVPAGVWNFRPAGTTGGISLVGAITSGNFATVLQTAALASVQILGVKQISNLYVDNHTTNAGGLFPISDGTSTSLIVDQNSAIVQDVAATGAAILFSGGAGAVNFDQAAVTTVNGGTNAIRNSGGSGGLILNGGKSTQIGANQFISTAGTPFVYQGFGTTFAAQAGAAAMQPNGSVKYGAATLDGVTGKTAAITANVTSSSIITIGVRNSANSSLTGCYEALAGDFVTGPQGSFKLSAVLQASDAGALNTLDTSQLYYSIFTP